jgi:hypothetical protein
VLVVAEDFEKLYNKLYRCLSLRSDSERSLRIYHNTFKVRCGSMERTTDCSATGTLRIPPESSPGSDLGLAKRESLSAGILTRDLVQQNNKNLKGTVSRAELGF